MAVGSDGRVGYLSKTADRCRHLHCAGRIAAAQFCSSLAQYSAVYSTSTVPAHHQYRGNGSGWMCDCGSLTAQTANRNVRVESRLNTNTARRATTECSAATLTCWIVKALPAFPATPGVNCKPFSGGAAGTVRTELQFLHKPAVQ